LDIDFNCACFNILVLHIGPLSTVSGSRINLHIVFALQNAINITLLGLKSAFHLRDFELGREPCRATQ
jgi:hypothetical protein